ncbi:MULTISPECIES: TetR/AcrR family transcriptional regulator [unclassified Isoptericola]|uniref:TetR/AcrR family transcriptional regulator n=1 Tax=unclassified Isoptericola TaxID=2623355 RepID=UPI0036463E56
MDTETPRTPARRGRPRRDEAEARREAILDAATVQLAEHGFAGTTIEGVAAAAGVTKRTIYARFTDKEGLFLAAVERLHRHEQEGLHAGDDLEEVATRVVRTLHGDDAVTLHRLVVAEARQLPRLAADFYANGPARTVEVLAELLAAEHPGLGDVPVRAEELYTLLLGEPHRRRLLGLEPAPSPAAARAHARRALRTVAGPVPPRP